MDASVFKDRLIIALGEAISANKDQISGVGADDFASYRYMLGIAHTLEDMKARWVQKTIYTGEYRWVRKNYLNHQDLGY